jgi:hypothetical protein
MPTIARNPHPPVHRKQTRQLARTQTAAYARDVFNTTIDAEANHGCGADTTTSLPADPLYYYDGQNVVGK